MSPERPSWDAYFMSLAQAASTRSTCSRLQVGAVLVADNRVMGTGFNGAPSGMDHCDHTFRDGPCEISVHAEVNALLFAQRIGFGCELYVTHAPCFQCAKLILNTGVSRVVFRELYKSDRGVLLLGNQGLEVERYE